MNRTAAASLALAGLMLAATAFAQTCPPRGMSREQLLELKSQEFKLSDTTRRQALALDLVACLGSPDPTLRDGVAFEALAAWMRDKQLSPATVGTIRDRLVATENSAVERARRPLRASADSAATMAASTPGSSVATMSTGAGSRLRCVIRREP